jgi:hypothetical protein
MMLALKVFGCHVTVQCEDVETHAQLVANYGHLESPRTQVTCGTPSAVNSNRKGIGSFLLSALASPPSVRQMRESSSSCSRRI